MNRITDDIIYVGVNDYDIDLFEGHYQADEGMTYNSYVITDEKNMVVATTDQHFIDEWMANVTSALNGSKPDYLLIQHMEPDHSAAIQIFMDAYPECIVAASKPALNMMKNYFGTDYPDRNLIIKEGDSLNLGSHEITFTGAPMVHWPEVMMAYDKKDKVLFTADAFGRFGAPADHSLDAASAAFEDEEWACEARRYYFGIVGKFGDSVVKVLEKTADSDISVICSLHGPVLTHDLDNYLNLYRTWAAYDPEEKGIAICYSSVYGHTKAAVEMLEGIIRELDKGIRHCEPGTEGITVELFDLARCDMAEAVEAAFQYDRLVLATTTYNNGVFPCMREFIDHLTERNFQKRTVGLIENGSWGPKAAGVMKEMLSECKDIEFCENTVTIKAALNDASRAQIAGLAKELVG